MVPREVTVAVVEEELPAASAFAQRHGWIVTWVKDTLTLLAEGRDPADGSSIRLQADLAGYRAVPPAWSFLAPDPKSPEKNRFPAAGGLPGGIGSIFHSNRVICAPFNRLAFKDHGGPHDNWGGPTEWLKVRGSVRASKLGEMLAQILLHLRYSPGWQQ